MTTPKTFMEVAIKKASSSLRKNHGGPFGAIIVKDGKIISKANNEVMKLKDPTAHAEIQAIRKACKKLKAHSLEGCILYTSCEPCPMCLCAAMWANIDKIYYGASKKDADEIGFRDDVFYTEFNKKTKDRKLKLVQVARKEAVSVMNKWTEKEDKKHY